MSFMRVNYRRAGQRCLLLLTLASPASTLPSATLSMPVLNGNRTGKLPVLISL